MNTLKTRLKGGDFVTAAWVELGHPDIAELLVRHGWTTIVIDGEHGLGDLEDWVTISGAVQAAGGEVVLRVPDGSDAVLKRVLDRGFRSIIVPMVNSAEQARAIARSCRYPSRGSRGYAAPVVRAPGVGTRPGSARDEAHDDLLLFVQCEHPETVDALSEIVETDGVDGIFLGPIDLAAAMGHLERMEDRAPQALMAQVEQTVAGSGKLLATATGGGRGWADLRDRGFHLVVGVKDVSMLAVGARAALAERDKDLGRRS